jgi:hypothetical protein
VAAPTLPLRASDEQVAVAWLSTIPEIAQLATPPPVATILPGDVDEQGVVAPWVKTGFVTVSVVGGGPDNEIPVNRPVMQVDCWATVPGSNRPPWPVAAALANAVRYACWSIDQTPRPLTLSIKGKQYPLAVVQGARLLTAFRRRYSDAADYACMSADLWLNWIAPFDRITT